MSDEERALALVKGFGLVGGDCTGLGGFIIESGLRGTDFGSHAGLEAQRLKLSANKNPRAMLWASLQTHTKKECPTVNYTTRIEPLLFTKDEGFPLVH